ncbi:MAG: bile acid:sodium symporter family protein [Brotaphodocola sp.]
MEKFMKQIGTISSLLTKYIGVIIIFFSILSFFWQDGFAWTTKYTSIFLGVAMFGMGLTIKSGDFQVVFSRPKEVIIGCIAQYTVMPLVAWILAVVFHLPEDLVIGVILVGCCPGGTASNVITYIAGGDVALSVGMTIVSTLAAPIMTPMLVYVLAGAWVEVSFWAMVLSVVKVILVPVLFGVLIRSLFGRQIQKISEMLPIISVVSIVMIISGIVANNAEKIVSCGVLVLCVVALHNLFGMGLGLMAAKLLKVEYSRATAIAIEVGMQNSGLAVSLATANFAANPLATLPGAIFSVWHNISGSVFAGIRRRRTAEEGKTVAVQDGYHCTES